MVAGEFGNHGEPEDDVHTVRSSSQGEAMMLDSKFFPGHPNLGPSLGPGLGGANLGPAGPYSPTFGRKDIFTQRKQREFIPENKKDDSYWDRRRRNNEAAKRSREKRRLNDMLLETRVLELTKDNHILQAQLNAIYEKYGIKGESMISMDQVLSTLPSNDQVLNFTKKRLGPIPGPMTRPSSPMSFHSLSLPLSINNNNNNINNNNNNNNNHSSSGRGGASENLSSSTSHDMRSCSPVSHSPDDRAFSSPSPSPHYNSAPNPHHQEVYPDIRSYAETGHMYTNSRRPFSRPAASSAYEDEQNDDKDSGLALNLSTDRAGSDGRSSGSGSPPVTSSNIIGEREGSSSGDESGCYPRSPNSSGEAGGGSNGVGANGSGIGGAGVVVGGSSNGGGINASLLPHKLRFKTVSNEKEAVSSLLSLHQIAMIKREPAEHINHWMERMENSGSGAGGGGMMMHSPNFFASLLPQRQGHDGGENGIVCGGGGGNDGHNTTNHHSTDGGVVSVGEPLLKRSRPAPNNLTDEVARLTSEVATLKNILVNRMKDETSETLDE